MSLSRLLLPIGKDPKSIPEIVSQLKTEILGLQQIQGNFIQELTAYFIDSNRNKDICSLLKKIKEMIYGSITSEPESDKNRSQLVYELYKTELLLILIENLRVIPSDGRKDIALIYDYVIGQQIGTRLPSVEYICSKTQILDLLMEYYGSEQFVSTCGQIIRGCLRFETLTELIFIGNSNQKLYLKLFDYVKSDSFVVCSDVFATIYELFSRHKTLAKRVLLSDFDVFFSKLNDLLISNDYYIRRKSIKLLSQILFDRNHQNVMKRYINSCDNLKTIKTILESNCLYSSFDAFLVFYIFVVNPEKTSEIKKILFQFKESLIDFINVFQANEHNFDQYYKERENMIKSLNEIKN